MQFPLSYMIYTPMFDALPDAARTRGAADRLAAVLRARTPGRSTRT